MSTAILGTPYSPPSPPETNSSDTMSPVYPDRPIRPLPKKSLRARLSPEVAGTILYPPAPPSSNSLFYLPYADPAYQRSALTGRSEVAEIDKALIEAQKAFVGDSKNSYQFKGNEVESDDEEGLGIIQRYQEYQQRQAIMLTSIRGNANRNSENMSQSVASSNDSVDGYDSFENTNNKKKRKIPTSGGLGNSHSAMSASLSAELANMGLSSPHEDEDVAFVTTGGTVAQYYGDGSVAVASTASGTGISGAGRGRYGRSGRRDASGRSPLGVTMNGSNAWQMGRFVGARRDYSASGSLMGKASELPADHGIISAAIAEAAALPVTPPKGQENVSLLEQQPARKSTPARTQFTFTCESDSTKGMVWPGDQIPFPGPSQFQPPSSMMPAPPGRDKAKGFSTQGTQTSPTMAGQNGQDSAAPPGPGQDSNQVSHKPRRTPSRRYAIAARERRLQQEYNNYHHPPREEDIWICEFCEYESIFGRPPEALVRQYEIKDRRERKRLAEKRRLLEKAKMKGRKGKKGSKNAKSNLNSMAAVQPHGAENPQGYEQHQPSLQSHGTQSDDFYGEDYDDDPIPMPAPPLQTPTKIPQPIGQNHQWTARTAHTNGVGGTRVI